MHASCCWRVLKMHMLTGTLIMKMHMFMRTLVLKMHQLDENTCVWYMLMRTRADAAEAPRKTLKGLAWMERVLHCCHPLYKPIHTRQMMNKRRRRKQILHQLSVKSLQRANQCRERINCPELQVALQSPQVDLTVAELGHLHALVG